MLHMPTVEALCAPIRQRDPEKLARLLSGVRGVDKRFSLAALKQEMDRVQQTEDLTDLLVPYLPEMDSLAKDQWLADMSQWGPLRAVEALLDAGAALDPPRPTQGTEVKYLIYHTPLMRAAKAGRVDVAKVLIDRGCERNNVDQDEETALFWAALQGEWKNAGIVDFLCEQGLDPNHPNRNGDTVLHMLGDFPVQDQEEEKFAIAVKLVSLGARLDVKNTAGRTPEDKMLSGPCRAWPDHLRAVLQCKELDEASAKAQYSRSPNRL